MIHQLRQQFNQLYHENKYQNLVELLQTTCNGQIDFRICETPIFADKDLKEKLAKSADAIIASLCQPNFKALTKDAIPQHLWVENENQHPNFVCIDFAVCKDENGAWVPKLIELQGFASMFCWMPLLAEVYQKHYSLTGLTPFFNGLNQSSYKTLLKETLLGTHAAENVILLEIEPTKQKTRVDFLLTEEWFGIKPVCLSELIQEGSDLYYLNEGKKTQVKRIYNRLIFDDLLSRPDFEYRVNLFEPLNVEWAGHPNWFYRISKYTMPLLAHESVPPSVLVSNLKEIPESLDEYVLKPLYSFAGQGVILDVTPEAIKSINEPSHWILQKKVTYADAINSPEGPVKCEIRMMYLWPDKDEKPSLAITLGRMSRGKMIGVNFNKDLNWVGSTVTLFES